VRVGPARHDDLHLRGVPDQVLDDVAQDARGHEDLRTIVVPGGCVGTGGQPDGHGDRYPDPSKNGSHIRNGRDLGYHSQITTTTPTTLQDAATATDLELAYGSRTVLAAASFAIPTAAVTALIGPNGAGKTTLLHALAGLLSPRSGRLDVPAGRRRGGVAYVLQATQVNRHLPLTVREAVTMGRYATAGPVRRLRAEDRAAVDRALEALQITDLANRPLHDLSGGQRQRAFVAQGLAQGADVLLLDEPITGLDLVSRQHILDAIASERAAGRAVVVSTHDLGDAAAADHLLLLAGRVVASGAPASVLTDVHLADAYGGHLLRFGESTLILDDHPHH
jgi:manganese transport system ATP-binding protein